ncbi:PrgI family protein [Lachnospiraceae bacterium XBB1006]|nr:PrgI family protein [Lachnospiraceae bacterium XBB1006]
MRELVIEINKDIDRYKETVAMGLNAKQLLFSIASVAVGGGMVLLLYPYIGLTGAAYVTIPCVAPIALGGFYSYNGMGFYEYMGRKLYFITHNRVLLYQSTEGEQMVMSDRLEQETDKKRKKKKRKK